MITVTVMTATGPLPVKVEHATEAKISERGALVLYNLRNQVIAAFAAWAYWIDNDVPSGKLTP